MPGPSEPSVRRFAALLAVIAVLALAGRLVYVATVTQYDRRFYDAGFYQLEAETLADGNGFVNPFEFLPGQHQRTIQAADHPPLTSVVLTPVAMIWTKDPQIPMRVVMSVLGALVVVVAGLLGRAVGGDRVGLLAAVLTAVYPNLWMNDGLIMAETLAALTSAAVLLFTVYFQRRLVWWWVVSAGVACGFAMLTRAELALLLPLVVVPAILLVRDASWGRRVALSAGAIAAALIVAGPWVVYNLTRFEKPTFLSTGDGLVLSGANCRDTYEGGNLGGWSLVCGQTKHPERDQSVISAELRDRAFRYIEDHAGRLPVTAAARVGRVWSIYRQGQMVDLNQGEGRPRWASWTGLAMFWLLVPFAAWGAWRLRKDGCTLLVLLMPFAIVTLFSAVFYGIARFRIAAEVPLVVLAAIGVMGIVAARNARGAADPEVAGADPRTQVAAG